jgi:transposase
MKHGHHIPASDRDDMAKLAHVLTHTMTRAEAIKDISKMFQVSEPTARNLISRGRYLAAQDDGRAA